MSAKWLSPKELGLRLRELRERIGATQMGLAKLVDRPGSQTEISKLEGGVWKGEEPNVPLLAAIVEAAGETLSYFRADGAVVLTEADEKRIAAKWMERVAKRLREEATSAREGQTEVETRLVGRGKARRQRGGKSRAVPDDL